MTRKTYAVAAMLFLVGSALSISAQTPSTSQNLTNVNDLDQQVGVLHKAAKYREAIPLAIQSLNLREKALGSEHADTATSLNNLASLYYAMGDYAKAETFYQRALTIYEKALGPEDPNTATGLNNLALLYFQTGDYHNAEPLFRRALEIREKVFGRDNPNTANSLGSLAVLYFQMGDYAKAQPLYERTLAVHEKTFGTGDPKTANSLTALAILYHHMGNYDKAKLLYQHAFEINEKALGPQHPTTASSLSNLAGLFRDTGDYVKAKAFYERALKTNEKALGSKHPDSVVGLYNLAGLYRDTRDYAKARALYQRALEMFDKTLGPKHPNTAMSLHNLADLYRKMGDYAKAEPLYRRALKIYEGTLGEAHPDTAKTLTKLADVYIMVGNSKEAGRRAKEALHAEQETLSNILSFTSEQQRLAFQKTTHPYDLPAALGNAQELADIVLTQKGIVLDSLLEDRLVAEASKDPRQHEIVTQLRTVKQRLMQLSLEPPEKELKKSDTEKEELSQQVEELEAGLARQVAGIGRARRALSVTTQQVKSALGKDEVLVELLRYKHYLGKDKFNARYGAVVIAPSGESNWVPLGGAAEIENNVALYQKSARGTTDDKTLDALLRRLHAQIWIPIEKVFPTATKTVIISPDGELNFVSFATLVTREDKFLAEKYFIRYVASGRDLLRITKASQNENTIIFANPDFRSKSTSSDPDRGVAVSLRSIESRELQDISLPPIPGTAAEATAIEQRAGALAKVFLGSNATEAELRRVNSPDILHLATHGFFLPENGLRKSDRPMQGDQEVRRTNLVNPMYRSGLAFAGAKTTLEAWAGGNVPATENDGIVTAEEVGGLELDGTWLVVLSACETGIGEARAGEGVRGLRRGFIQAGAQNLLMTLWPINDETTVRIMLDFYDAATTSKKAARALANVQRDWLVELRKQRGLSAAVNLAGPFIMSSQGQQ